MGRIPVGRDIRKARGAAGQFNNVWRFADAQAIGEGPHQITIPNNTPSTNKRVPTTGQSDIFACPTQTSRKDKGKKILEDSSSGPHETDLLLGLDQAQTKNKRKPTLNLQIPNRPEVKRPSQKENPTREHANPAAQIELNPEAFYEAKINQELGEKIAAACGVSLTVVEQVLAADNEERRQIMLTDEANLMNSQHMPPTEEEMAEMQKRFELDPADELGTDED